MVQFLGQDNGQIDGRQGLSLSRQGAGNHQGIVICFGSALQDVSPQHLILFDHGRACFPASGDDPVPAQILRVHRHRAGDGIVDLLRNY